MKEKISTFTTALLVKSYVGMSVALCAAKTRKQGKKRNNDFSIRKRLAISKMNATASDTN